MLLGTTNQTSGPGPGKSQQFCHAKDLIGADVKDAQGQKLGDIHDILFNPKTGEAFAAIGLGGDKYAMVPSRALLIAPAGAASVHAEVTLNTTKEAFQSGPSLAENQWQNLDNPGFTEGIYIHYHLQGPAAMGGANAPAGISTGVGASSTNKDR